MCFIHGEKIRKRSEEGKTRWTSLRLRAKTHLGVKAEKVQQPRRASMYCYVALCTNYPAQNKLMGRKRKNFLIFILKRWRRERGKAATRNYHNHHFISQQMRCLLSSFRGTFRSRGKNCCSCSWGKLSEMCLSLLVEWVRIFSRMKCLSWWCKNSSSDGFVLACWRV